MSIFYLLLKTFQTNKQNKQKKNKKLLCLKNHPPSTQLSHLLVTCHASVLILFSTILQYQEVTNSRLSLHSELQKRLVNHTILCLFMVLWV